MKDKGKQFEADIKSSCKKQDIFCLRLKDGGGWKKGDDTRFTSKNLCDYVLHLSGTTYLVECKSHKGISVPAKEMPQLEEMAEIDFNGVEAVFFINYREYAKTYIIEAKKIVECLKKRKSLDLQFCKDNGTKINQKKLRVNYTYDLKKSLIKM